MKYNLTIKWAAIFFVVTLLWMLFEKMMGWHGARISQHAIYSGIYDLLFLFIYAIAFWDRKRSGPEREFSWRHGFRFGLGLTVLVTALSPLVQFITHRLISPEFFPNVIDLAVENQLLTLEAAQDKFNLGNYIVENIIGTFVLGTIYSLILAAVFSKKNLAITVGFIVGTVSYWLVPYNQLHLFGVHIYYIMAIGAFAGTFIITLIDSSKPLHIALLLSLGVVIAVLCRIFFDLANDPGTHNLFPFEVAITLGLTAPSALIGSYLSHFIKTLRRR